jgi:hypothetical protein
LLRIRFVSWGTRRAVEALVDELVDAAAQE